MPDIQPWQGPGNWGNEYVDPFNEQAGWQPMNLPAPGYVNPQTYEGGWRPQYGSLLPNTGQTYIPAPNYGAAQDVAGRNVPGVSGWGYGTPIPYGSAAGGGMGAAPGAGGGGGGAPAGGMGGDAGGVPGMQGGYGGGVFGDAMSKLDALLAQGRNEAQRRANEANNLRNRAIGVMEGQANRPAIGPEVERQIRGQVGRNFARREQAIGLSTRDALGRAGLLGTGRGVEYARRTRSEMGPGMASGLAQAGVDIAKFNASARQGATGQLAGYLGSMPTAGVDYTPEIGAAAGTMNMLNARDAERRNWQAIQDNFNQNQMINGAMFAGFNSANRPAANGLLSKEALDRLMPATLNQRFGGY